MGEYLEKIIVSLQITKPLEQTSFKICFRKQWVVHSWKTGCVWEETSTDKRRRITQQDTRRTPECSQHRHELYFLCFQNTDMDMQDQTGAWHPGSEVWKELQQKKTNTTEAFCFFFCNLHFVFEVDQSFLGTFPLFVTFCFSGGINMT